MIQKMCGSGPKAVWSGSVTSVQASWPKAVLQMDESRPHIIVFVRPVDE